MDVSDILIASFLIVFLLLGYLVFIAAVEVSENAVFVCQSHGLQMIDYEREYFKLTKVECGNKKPELQYDEYKVFTK